MNFVDAAEMCAVPSRVDTHRLEELYIGSWFPEDGIGLMDSLFVRSPAFRRGQAPPSCSNCSTASQACREVLHGSDRSSRAWNASP